MCITADIPPMRDQQGMGDPGVQAGLLQEECRAKMEILEAQHDSKRSLLHSVVLLNVPM